MIFTKEQYDKIGHIEFCDFPIDGRDEELSLKIFNHLPEHIQGAAVQWGCSDTVVRDDIFEFLIETQFGMSCKEFYKNGMITAIRKSGQNIGIDFEAMKKGR